MFTAAKHAIVRRFNIEDLDIRLRRPPLRTRVIMPGALAQLARLGFMPQTLVKVGIAYKSSEVCQVFRDANIPFIQPLVEFEPFLPKICATDHAQHVLPAPGETPCAAVLKVHDDKISCLRNEVETVSVDGSRRTVLVITIDVVCIERNQWDPFLIKVVIQGALRRVFAEAKRTLQETQTVTLEVTFFDTTIDGPQYYDVVARAEQYGFVNYDFWSFLHHPHGNTLCPVEMLFARNDGRYRQSHVYATPAAASYRGGLGLRACENG
jgi:hypothetical protein